MRVVIRNWLTERNYGWATMPNLGGDVFIHGLQLLDLSVPPKVGDVVEIDGVQATPQGRRATGWIALVPPNTPDDSSKEQDDEV